MDLLRNTLQTIQKNLGQLTLTHKLLVAMIAVVITMSMLLVWSYTSRASYVEFLPGATPEQLTKASAFLTSRGVTPDTRNGRLFVLSTQHAALFSDYVQSGNLPEDASMLFKGMLERQTWYSTRQQNEQVYNLALQNELARVISNFRGIEKASVLIDVPERGGIGSGSRRPTASAVVHAAGGKGLDQSSVDAIAALVASSRAGLSIENVRVIDGNLRRQRRATTQEDMAASTYLEDVTRWENQTREKLSQFLAYIPDVMIAVTAQIDNSRLNRVREEFLPKDSGTLMMPKREKGMTSTQAAGSAPGGEAGIRSNVGMDVASSAGGAAAPTSTQKEEESEFQTFPGRVQDSIVDNKGRPTMVAVSVNVPRSFVAAQLAPADAGGAAGGAEGAATGPSEEQLRTKFDSDVKPKIISSILPHVKAMIAAANPALSSEELEKLLMAQVSVSMIPFESMAFSGSAGGGGMLSVGSGSGGSLPLGLSVGLVQNAILGVLALAALGMMFTMVKRAGRRVETPTPEEIVGLPPALDARSDLIGEAEEGDAPMVGIEVDDAEMRTGKMLEQVDEFVKGSPDTAAKLLNRWIAAEN